MPTNVLIRYDLCKLTLNLPIFFEEQSLSDIRKVFKLISDRIYQNETALEKLDHFWPEWEQTLKNHLEQVTTELETAQKDAEGKKRFVEGFGAALDEIISKTKDRIAEGKKWLAQAQNLRKSKPEEINEIKETLNKLKAMLDTVMFPKKKHMEAVKEVRRLEKAVKDAKAAVMRGEKIINAYKAIKV